MKRIASWRDLKPGLVFNRVYNGKNRAFARINGKQTLVVLKATPTLEAVELFDEFGSPRTPDLRSDVITFTDPERAFE